MAALTNNKAGRIIKWIFERCMLSVLQFMARYGNRISVAVGSSAARGVGSFRGDGLEQAEPAKTNHQFAFRTDRALVFGVSDRTMNWSVMCFQISSIAEFAGSRRTHDIESALKFGRGIRELINAGQDFTRASE